MLLVLKRWAWIVRLFADKISDMLLGFVVLLPCVVFCLVSIQNTGKCGG